MHIDIDTQPNGAMNGIAIDRVRVFIDVCLYLYHHTITFKIKGYYRILKSCQLCKEDKIT